jgi:hypothetical protein
VRLDAGSGGGGAASDRRVVVTGVVVVDRRLRRGGRAVTMMVGRMGLRWGSRLGRSSPNFWRNRLVHHLHQSVSQTRRNPAIVVPRLASVGLHVVEIGH